MNPLTPLKNSIKSCIFFIMFLTICISIQTLCSEEQLYEKLAQTIKTNKEQEFNALLQNADPKTRAAAIAYKDNNNNTLLHIAAQKNNEQIIQSLIDNGADVEATNTMNKRPIDLNYDTILQGYTSAHTAAKKGDLEKLKKTLTEHPEFLNKQAALTGDTPLHLAASLSDENIAKKITTYLLEQKADPSIQNNKKYTALHIAAEKNNIPVMELLVDAGANVQAQSNTNQTPRDIFYNKFSTENIPLALYGAKKLHRTTYNGTLNDVKQVIVQDGKKDIEYADILGRTPLFYAAHNPDISALNYLLAEGAQKYRHLVNGDTILHYALKNSDVPIIKELSTDQKLLNDQSNSLKQTPFHYAASKEANETILKTLINNMQRFDLIDAYGNTPLLALIKNPHTLKTGSFVTIIKTLIEKYPDAINQADTNGNTPLHILIKQAKSFSTMATVNDILQLLLTYNANPRLKNHDNKTALELAQEENLTDIVKRLQEKTSTSTTQPSPLPPFNTSTLSKFSASLSVLAVILEGTK